MPMSERNVVIRRQNLVFKGRPMVLIIAAILSQRQRNSALWVSLIDLPAVTQCQYQYDQAVVLNVADGSIIADTVKP
jgi:hypothetical protein